MVRIAGGLGSAARVLAVLGVGAAAGAALTSHLGAQAQDGSAAALAALEARVAAIENGEKPLKAPFQVVDAGGQTIFSVTEQDGGATLVVGTASSGLVTLSTTGDELEVSLAKGDSTARMTASGDMAELKLGNPGGSVSLKQTGDAPSLAMTQGGDQVLGFEATGGGPQLTVRKGSDAVRLAVLPDETAVVVEAKGTRFQMGDVATVRGFAASRNGQPLAGIGAQGDDKYRVVIYNGGSNPVFEGGFDRVSGKAGLVVGDESGNRVAEITSDAAAGKLKLLKAGGDAIVVLGPDEGGGDGASLRLGVGDNSIVARATGSLATIIAKAAGKLTEMGVGEKSNGFVIASGGKPIAALGDNGDGKPFLSIYNPGSPQPAISLGMSTGQAMLRMFNPSGGLALVAGALDGRGSVKVYDDNRIMAGMEAKGGNSAIIYVASNEHDVAGIYNDAGKGMVVVQDQQGQFAKLYSVGNRGALVLGDGKNTEASLGPTESNKNSAVRIFSQGQMVFAAGSTNNNEGAAVVLSGGQQRAGLQAQGNNGKVYVLSGASEVASINSNDVPGQGLVVVRSSGSGNPLVRMIGTGSGGSMVVSDSGGSPVLEARADPALGGTVCVNYKNVEKCLGRGLTGLEGFH